MDEPLSQSASGATPTAASGGAQTPAATTARSRPVLLRIPDCTARVTGTVAGKLPGRPPARGWTSRLTSVGREFIRPWLRPRSWLAGALGLALVLIAVALLAATRGRGPKQAGGTSVELREEASPWSPATGATGASTPAAEGGLIFPTPEANAVRANEAATIGAPGANGAAQSSPGPCAHLEQRIDRVSVPY